MKKTTFKADKELVKQVAEQLIAQKKTLAVAESCTGGSIASVFTAIPGASSFFKGGIVPYQTQIKKEVLGIAQEVIKRYSVVSAEVAYEMAAKTQQMFKADWVIATTGNAGPSKGDSDAEIGTVYIAVGNRSQIAVEKLSLGKSREEVIQKAVASAVLLLKNRLAEEQ